MLQLLLGVRQRALPLESLSIHWPRLSAHYNVATKSPTVRGVTDPPTNEAVQLPKRFMTLLPRLIRNEFTLSLTVTTRTLFFDVMLG
jgi:hypothetical protein